MDVAVQGKQWLVFLQEVASCGRTNRHRGPRDRPGWLHTRVEFGGDVKLRAVGRNVNVGNHRSEVDYLPGKRFKLFSKALLGYIARALPWGLVGQSD